MTADKRTNEARLGPTDLVFEVQHQGHDCVQVFQYHTAHADPGILEAYCYTSRISYAPGETVEIHASATEPRVQLTIAAMARLRAWSPIFRQRRRRSSCSPREVKRMFWRVNRAAGERPRLRLFGCDSGRSHE